MKIAKQEDGIVYLRNVSFEDREIIALFGGKIRPDLFYNAVFKDSTSPWPQQVEAFELPKKA